jgi:hypothetical protein
LLYLSGLTDVWRVGGVAIRLAARVLPGPRSTVECGAKRFAALSPALVLDSQTCARALSGGSTLAAVTSVASSGKIYQRYPSRVSVIKNRPVITSTWNLCRDAELDAGRQRKFSNDVQTFLLICR